MGSDKLFPPESVVKLSVFADLISQSGASLRGCVGPSVETKDLLWGGNFFVKALLEMFAQEIHSIFAHKT